MYVLEDMAAAARVESAASFYIISAVLLWGIWICFSLISCTDWHRRGLVAPVITRPSWAPASLSTKLRSPSL
jgi:hypothetical protein